MFNSSKPSVSPLRSTAAAGDLSQTIRDRLNRRTNRVDRFRIALTNRSSFTANLRGIKQGHNVDLELRNSTGQVVAASRRRGKRNELITLADLNAGVYTLRAILKQGQQTRYRLNYASTAIGTGLPGGSGGSGDDGSGTPPADFAGNTLGTARNLGALAASGVSLNDYVGTSDTDDFYTFTVGELPNFPTAKLNVFITKAGGGEAEADLILRDRDGVILPRPDFTSYGPTGFTEALAAGTYTLQVKKGFYNDGEDYVLNLSATPVADNAGNTRPTARAITLGSTDSVFSDFVGAGDSDDWYQFTIASDDTDFTLKLTAPGGNIFPSNTDIDIRLRRGSLGEEIVRSTTVDSNNVLTFNETLTAGTYYLELTEGFYSGGSNDYELSLSSTAPAPSGSGFIGGGLLPELFPLGSL